MRITSRASNKNPVQEIERKVFDIVAVNVRPIALTSLNI